jgi:hypothetical protein
MQVNWKRVLLFVWMLGLFPTAVLSKKFHVSDLPRNETKHGGFLAIYSACQRILFDATLWPLILPILVSAKAELKHLT